MSLTLEQVTAKGNFKEPMTLGELCSTFARLGVELIVTAPKEHLVATCSFISYILGYDPEEIAEFAELNGMEHLHLTEDEDGGINIYTE